MSNTHQNISVTAALKTTVDSLARAKGVLNKELGEKVADISRGNSVTLNPLDLWIEEGFNIRDIDESHVNMLLDVILNEDTRYTLPPIEVKAVDVTDLDTGKTVTKLKVIDGHHRTLAYHAAIQKHGIDLDKITVIPFKGDEKAELVKMVVSTQNRKLSHMERARAYFRMHNKGMTNVEISKLCHDTQANVGSFLKLAEAPIELQNILNESDIAITTVFNLMRDCETFNQVTAACHVLVTEKAERKQAIAEAKNSGIKPSKTLQTSSLKPTKLNKKEVTRTQDVITNFRDLLSDKPIKEGEKLTVELSPEMVQMILELSARIDEVETHNANVSVEQARLAQKIKESANKENLNDSEGENVA